MRTTYDADGNITFEVIGEANAAESEKEYKSYLYDAQNRLTRYNDSALDITIVYEYDARGNILSYTTYEYSAYTNDVDTSTAQTFSLTYASTTWDDLLTHINGTRITYDGSGNPSVWKNGETFTWTQGRRLASVTNDSGTTTYTYDENGIRTAKSGARNTEYIVVDGTYLGERTTIGSTEYLITYLYGDSGVIGIERNGSRYYFVKNLQGDVTALMTTDGTIVANYAYDAYGNVISVTNRSGSAITSPINIANMNPFRYRGYMYDQETGFYYLTSRYYDAEVGRFLNADSVVAGVNENINGNNLFAYCFNNPVMFTDSDGDWPNASLLFKGALAATIGVMAVTAVLATGGTCLPLVALGYSVVATAGTVMAVTGASEVVESFTGKNRIKDKIGEDGFNTLQYGATVVLSYGPTILEAGMASVCFVEGTSIATAVGKVAIEDIKAGDLVYATDPETGETELKEVVQTFENETTELVHLTVNGEEIITTPSHPFWAPKKGWTSAVNLRAGDMLQLLNGEYVILEAVQHEILETPITVYNFEVEDFHTYYVTDSEILVHNSCGPNGSYEKASYHNRGNALKSAAPMNGQEALDNSYSLGPTTNRRIGISQGQFVVLDQTSAGIYHGHVRTWNELTVQMRNVLIQNNAVNRKGKILG